LRIKPLIYALIFASLAGCKDASNAGSRGAQIVEDNSGQFPPVVSLDSIKTTEFVPTMEHALPLDKNVIYAPAFLYAWDEIRKIGRGSVKVPNNNPDMLLINASTSHKDALTKKEYTVKVDRDGNNLHIKASFTRSLHFNRPLDTAMNKFLFRGVSVRAFGMPHYSYNAARQIDILFYESDDRFIFRIVPGKASEEIVFANGFGKEQSFDQILHTIEAYRAKGDRERKKTLNEWKYSFRAGDVVLIPAISFDYKTAYRSIEGQTIFAGPSQLEIQVATQRTGFVLNERGVRVESEGDLYARSADADLPEESTAKHDKKLELNTEFIVIMKKLGTTNPYFMMAVRNAGFMVKR
jgi:hypothetical protein